MAKKLKLAIISEAIRRDNHAPLRYFDKIEVKHFYHSAPYGDLAKEELESATSYKDYKELWGELVNFCPDVLQGPEPYASRMSLKGAIFAYRMSKRVKAKLIFPVLENLTPFERFGGVIGLFLREFLRYYGKRADTVFCLNKGARQNLLQAGIDSEKIIRFPWGIWGVNTDEFTPKPKKTDPDYNQPTLLFVGRLIPDKGIDDLLQAFLTVLITVKTSQLIFIGDGPKKADIEKFAVQNKLVDKIKLLGTLKNRDLPPYFRAATVSVYPSVTVPRWKEQIGTVNLQAMACGTPVVSTLSGAIPEYVPDEVAGYLVPEHSPEHLGRAIIKIITDPKLHSQMGQAAREHVLKNYSAEKNVKFAQNWLIERFENV